MVYIQLVAMEKCNSSRFIYNANSNILLCFQDVTVIVIERKQSSNNSLHCNVTDPRPG